MRYKYHAHKEYIVVGCVPTAAVAITRCQCMMSGDMYLPGEGVLSRGVSLQMGDLPVDRQTPVKTLPSREIGKYERCIPESSPQTSH